MAYKIVKTQPKPRSPDLKWEDTGPGLYDDGEVLVEVDGIFAAVSFETEWLENGSGVSIKGTARWCEKNGETHLCAGRKHVETFASLTVDPVQVKLYGVEALAKEVLLGMLGEEPLLTREVPEETGPPSVVPVIQFSEEGRLNMSIVHAASTVQSTRTVSNSLALLS